MHLTARTTNPQQAAAMMDYSAMKMMAITALAITAILITTA